MTFLRTYYEISAKSDRFVVFSFKHPAHNLANLDTLSLAAQTVKYFTSLPFRPHLICVQSRSARSLLNIKGRKEGGRGASHLARTHFQSIKNCGESMYLSEGSELDVAYKQHWD